MPIICLFLSSCFEVEETYNLNADGSYTSQHTVNMGGLMSMAMGMMPDSTKNKPSFSEAKDTTFNMASKMPDSIRKRFSAEEYNLISNTDMNLQMKLAEGVFKVGFTNKGKSANELNYFLTNFGELMKKGKVSELIGKSLAGEQKGPAEMPGAEEDSPFSNDEFSYVINNTTFERKIKPDVIAAKQQKNEQVYKMIEGMKLKMTSTIIVNLPRPAKSIENPKAVLSADKKQFKLVIDMFEALKDPASLNFKVNY